MMRRIKVLISLILTTLWLNIYSATLEPPVTIPANNSNIKTFELKFQFDLSEISAELGNDNIAVGYSGMKSANYNTRLYDGTPETGILMETVLTSTFKGSGDAKDFVEIPFSSGFVPEPGHIYTVVCNNQFKVYNLETGSIIDGTLLNYKSDPLILTFYGTEAGSSELLFQKASISNNDNVDSVNSISFEFNADISVAQDKTAQILCGAEQFASSKSVMVDPTNGKSLVVNFDEVTLYLGKQYTINLPEGIVCLKNNSSVLNKSVEITVNGSSTIRLSTKSVSPENNSTALPESAEIRFNLEPGQTLTPPPNISHKRDIDFYKGEISESNLISTLHGTANEDGITWDLSEFRFDPETKYILRKKADDITVWVDGKSQPAYGNEEVIISFTTPSVEEAGFAPMEFSIPKIQDTDLTKTDYIQDMEIPYLGTFYLELKDRTYNIDSKSYELYPHPNAQDCRLYEVTGDGDKLIKSVQIGRTPTEDKYEIWISAQIFIESYLYAGKKYKLVIPAESFTVSPPIKEHGDKSNTSKCNYIKNDELVYTFIGTNPTECVLLDCNVADNATVSSLYNVVWTFEGDYHLSDDITTVTYQATSTSGVGVAPIKKSVKLSKTLGGANTAVMVDFVDSSTGKPTTVNKGTKSTITVPKGLIVNTLNDDIVNDEIVLTIIGGAEDPSNYMVKVNLTVEGVHTSSNDAVKDKDYTFTLTPAENWEVESVSSGGRNLTPVAGDNATNTYTYQLSTLRSNTDVNATYRYAGEWAQSNETTGVWTISDSNVRIYKDVDYIVVEGVNSDNTINVYTVGGMLVNSTRVSGDKDCVRITVSPGQYYIVTVDGVAAKLKM